ncbi:MAG TPA: DNA repair exonuclease [Longimicrobiales bacterium]|nr:DNA repair exonuclease [Longimicrobiales bacterium]
MRILHLADVHLDTSFSGRSPRVRDRLRRAVREAFREAVQLGLERRVHVVLIAGDLFDGVRLSFESERFLVAELERLTRAGIPVVYATGNHDPGSSRRRDVPWPEGVTVVADPVPRRIAVRDGEGAVVGWVTAAGHASSRETRDLAATFPEPDGALPEVALLHTQVVGSRDAGAHDPYAPTTRDTLLGRGYDYWALGHVHLRQVLSDLPGVHYPGNLQGRTLRETGPKGALVAEVARGFASQVEFVPLAPVRWEDVDVTDVSGARTAEGLIRVVLERWRAAREVDPDPGREWMVRIRLSGPSPVWRELADEEDRNHLARELEDTLGVLEVTLDTLGVHAPVDAAEHRGRSDVLGVALHLLEALREGRSELPELAEELAGAPAPEELAGYVSRVLEGAEGELASRLLDPES